MLRVVRPDLMEYLKNSTNYVAENGLGEVLEDYEDNPSDFILAGYMETPKSAEERGHEFGAYFFIDGMSGFIGQTLDLAPNTTGGNNQYPLVLTDPAPLQWHFVEEWLVPVGEE